MKASRVAPLCAALIALAATACGGGGHSASGNRSAVPTKSAAAAATAGTAGSESRVAGARQGRSTRPARMLSQAELEAATIGPKDLPGWRMSTIQGRGGDGVSNEGPIADVSRFPHIPQRACEPLLYMSQYASRHQYHASVDQTVEAGADDDSAPVTASVKSYSVADAPKVMSDMRSALASCTSFASLGEGERWTEVTKLADPGVGDEAVACRMTLITPSVDSQGDDDGGPPVHTRFAFVVVRSGAEIGIFEDFASPYRANVQVPMKPVTAQITKLAAVG